MLAQRRLHQCWWGQPAGRCGDCAISCPERAPGSWRTWPSRQRTKRWSPCCASWTTSRAEASSPPGPTSSASTRPASRSAAKRGAAARSPFPTGSLPDDRGPSPADVAEASDLARAARGRHRHRPHAPPTPGRARAPRRGRADRRTRRTARLDPQRPLQDPARRSRTTAPVAGDPGLPRRSRPRKGPRSHDQHHPPPDRRHRGPAPPDTDPYLSCDDCFAQLDEYVERRVLDAGHTTSPACAPISKDAAPAPRRPRPCSAWSSIPRVRRVVLTPAPFVDDRQQLLVIGGEPFHLLAGVTGEQSDSHLFLLTAQHSPHAPGQLPTQQPGDGLGELGRVCRMRRAVSSPWTASFTLTGYSFDVRNPGQCNVDPENGGAMADLQAQVASIGALAEPTRLALYRYVAGATGPVSREQAAAAVDLPLHSVKFHLDRLVKEGLLEVEYRRLTGRTGPGAGRPPSSIGEPSARCRSRCPNDDTTSRVRSSLQRSSGRRAKEHRSPRRCSRWRTPRAHGSGVNRPLLAAQVARHPPRVSSACSAATATSPDWSMTTCV